MDLHGRSAGGEGMEPIVQETVTKVIRKEIIYLNPAWLRLKRKEKGYSYRHLAKLVGVSASFLSDIEKGHRRMTNPVMISHCVSILVMRRWEDERD